MVTCPFLATAAGRHILHRGGTPRQHTKCSQRAANLQGAMLVPEPKQHPCCHPDAQPLPAALLRGKTGCPHPHLAAASPAYHQGHCRATAGDGCPDLSPYLAGTLAAEARMLAEQQVRLLHALPNRALAGSGAAPRRKQAHVRGNRCSTQSFSNAGRNLGTERKSGMCCFK